MRSPIPARDGTTDHVVNDARGLLAHARHVAASALGELNRLADGGRIVGREIAEREVKIAADAVLHDHLFERLQSTGLPVLSEESSESPSKPSGPYWSVDPLDGSYNFARSLGPAMISIALVDGGRPTFGVLRDVETGDEYWGGAGIGAFLGETAIRVSEESILSRSVLCTGFPSRFLVDDTAAMAAQTARMSRFGKIRMIGSAASSLVRVARGSAEAYVESRIMSWDVAAGLALIEGAGGSFVADLSRPRDPLDVVATNGLVDAGIA